MTQSMVRLENVVKRFGEQTVVDHLSLDIRHGEFLTLLGPSGCGKTTTLRMIAGFEIPSDGDIYIDGKQVDDIPAHKRDVNTVFQSYALFPHMTIRDNVGFGLKMKKVSKAEIHKRVDEVLDLVQLKHYADRKPEQLSGGQKQRVAIARALINNPNVLLLDEPLGALDLKLRRQMQVELKHLQQRLGITFIYVTHDQEEALTMSDRIAIMNNGVLEQIGTPTEIYEHPKSRFVANFIGQTNMFETHVTAIENDTVYVDVANVRVPTKLENGVSVGDEVALSIRPELIKLALEKNDAQFAITAKVKEQIYIGSVISVIVTLQDGNEVSVTINPHQAQQFPEDKEVYLHWEEEKAVIIQ